MQKVENFIPDGRHIRTSNRASRGDNYYKICIRIRIFIVLEDNQAAIFLSKSRKVHGRTKHIAVRYHYVRELIRDKELEVSYQPSEFNPADLFTKQLGIVLFVRHRQTVMGHALIQGVQQYYD